MDIMLKSADVEFVTWEKKLGGRLVTVIIKGNVADVKHAISKAADQSIKKLACSVVIANPHPEIIRMVQMSAAKLGGGQKTELGPADQASTER